MEKDKSEEKEVIPIDSGINTSLFYIHLAIYSSWPLIYTFGPINVIYLLCVAIPLLIIFKDKIIVKKTLCYIYDYRTKIVNYYKHNHEQINGEMKTVEALDIMNIIYIFSIFI